MKTFTITSETTFTDVWRVVEPSTTEVLMFAEDIINDMIQNSILGYLVTHNITARIYDNAGILLQTVYTGEVNACLTLNKHTHIAKGVLTEDGVIYLAGKGMEKLCINNAAHFNFSVDKIKRLNIALYMDNVLIFDNRRIGRNSDPLNLYASFAIKPSNTHTAYKEPNVQSGKPDLMDAINPTNIYPKTTCSYNAKCEIETVKACICTLTSEIPAVILNIGDDSITVIIDDTSFKLPYDANTLPHKLYGIVTYNKGKYTNHSGDNYGVVYKVSDDFIVVKMSDGKELHIDPQGRHEVIPGDILIYIRGLNIAYHYTGDQINQSLVRHINNIHKEVE